MAIDEQFAHFNIIKRVGDDDITTQSERRISRKIRHAHYTQNEVIIRRSKHETQRSCHLTQSAIPTSPTIRRRDGGGDNNDDNRNRNHNP